MIAFILRRIGGAIPVLLLVTLVTFALMRLIPGDPAAALAGVSATPQERAQIRHDLGLDEPYHLQLARWYGSLARGDLGRSILLGKSVTEATFERLPVTLSLSAYALVLTVVFGLALGVLAALRQNSWVDQAAMMLALVGISLPNFWLGLMMIVLFAVHLGWLPTGGYVNFTDDPWNWLRCTTMPAISLAALQMGLLARITRSTMLEVLRQDYIRTARAKGLPAWQVVGKHALAATMIPVLTVIGIIVSLLLSAAVVIETIFSIPGLGQLLTSAIFNRDYPLVQGGLLLITVFTMIVNILVDIAYAWADPRVHLEASS
ncbi:MAG: peptide/nickel transport system permease protein [Rhodospirillaceae bacterium]|jgi:peptide/nickel transport system permease protein|nr:peptide/nickel transport system permease protein [Rhodospirillaceae bacterium]MEA2850628.1 peptide/nickel transport system permease protein [Rhodospirillaceae bacterium]